MGAIEQHGNTVNKLRILTVIVVVGIVVAWLLSGILTKKPPDTPISLYEANKQSRISQENREPVQVRARNSMATEQYKRIHVQGRLIDRNQTTVSALTRGKIKSRFVDHGDVVSAGDLLCELEVQDREALLAVAQDALALSEKEFSSTLQLIEEGFQQELDIARQQASLSLSRQQLLATELELENTKIRAPISGVVRQVHASVGEYLDIGMPCATILVLNPLYAQGYVSERYIDALRVGSEARITLANNRQYDGQLSYVSKRADEQSRTFQIEVIVPNENYEIYSGVSASIELIVATQWAHKVPISVISVDDEGSLIVKTVNHNNQVVYGEVEILQEDADGVWVSGLPLETTVITLGQGLVVEQEYVSVEYE